MSNTRTVILYAIKAAGGENYYAGFDTVARRPVFSGIKDAKLFSNKNDIKLRENEHIVPLNIDVDIADMKIGQSFRLKPVKRKYAPS